jgi:hypothetical protein
MSALRLPNCITQPADPVLGQHASTLNNLFCCPGLHCSPSGYQGGDGVANCLPLSDPQVAVLILSGLANCSPQTIEGVRKAVYDFLSNPNSAYGE